MFFHGILETLVKNHIHCFWYYFQKFFDLGVIDGGRGAFTDFSKSGPFYSWLSIFWCIFDWYYSAIIDLIDDSSTFSHSKSFHLHCWFPTLLLLRPPIIEFSKNHRPLFIKTLVYPTVGKHEHWILLVLNVLVAVSSMVWNRYGFLTSLKI